MHPRREQTLVKRGDKRVPAQIVRCDNVGCNTTVEITHNTHKALPDVMIDKKLRFQGWQTGKHRICPDCVAKGKTSKKRDLVEAILAESLKANVHIDTHRLPEPPTPTFQEISDYKLRGAPFGPAGPTLRIAPEPEPITITYRHKEPEMPASVSTIHQNVEVPTDAFKKIFRAIDGQWDEGRRRYIGNMGDQGIATDLNFPRAWIEKVREEHFGPLNGNDEIELLKPAIEKALHDAATMRDNLLTEASKYDAVWKQMKDLQKRLERVEINVLPRR